MILIFYCVVLGIPAVLIILCARLFEKWNEKDRWLALVPLLPFPLWLLMFLFNVGRSSRSYNLFPIEIIGIAILGFMLLPIAAIVYDFRQRREAKRARSSAP